MKDDRAGVEGAVCLWIDRQLRMRRRDDAIVGAEVGRRHLLAGGTEQHANRQAGSEADHFIAPLPHQRVGHHHERRLDRPAAELARTQRGRSGGRFGLHDGERGGRRSGAGRRLRPRPREHERRDHSRLAHAHLVTNKTAASRAVAPGEARIRRGLQAEGKG
eukprot:6238609-Prymnesium_polylepis.2